ncbi:hypothetical protein P7C70_g1159, partial [Phenoliferia sp. Uapishka_3]
MATALPPPRIDLLVYSQSPAAFIAPLSLLLEPSPPLSLLLAPQLNSECQRLQSTSSPLPKTYAELLSIAATLVESWPIEDQAAFMSAHPRIGETKNLSALSGAEQSGKGNDTTPGEVLKRLSLLNTLYEESFPGLRYTTFVNGRSRAEIIPEMEVRGLPWCFSPVEAPFYPSYQDSQADLSIVTQKILGIELPPPSTQTGEPRLKAIIEKTQIRVMGSKAWRDELKRGMADLWSIARARAEGLGVK